MKRKIFRLLFYSIKFSIGMIAYLDPRIYMKYYNMLLRTTDMTINGTPRFIAKSVRFDDFDKITLGDRLVVSFNVYFLTHDYSYTTALISIGETPKTDIGTIREISIGDNVFIGMNSVLMPGTKIGDNVIIGAGSVIRGSIPSNSIVAGNPAEVIGDIVEYAKKIKNNQGYELRIDKK